MEIITVNKIHVEVEWKEIKNIHLTVYPPDCRVHISAPLSMPKDSIRLYIISKLTWIHKRIEMIRNQARQTDREYVSGENHYYKGIRYRLNVVYQQTPPAELFHLGRCRFRIPSVPYIINHHIGAILRDWPSKAGIKEGAPASVSGHQVIIPHHDTVIEAEDHVVVFCTSKRQVPKVEKLFQVGFHFL